MAWRAKFRLPRFLQSKIFQIGSHSLGRLWLVLFAFIIILNDPSQSPPAPLVQPSIYPDLQLVRLYQDAGQTWTLNERNRLAMLMRQRGDEQLATLLASQTTSNPQSMPLLISQADEALRDHNWDGVRQHLQSVLSLDQTHPQANLQMGILTLDQDEAQAVQYLGRVAQNIEQASDTQAIAAALLSIIQTQAYAPRDIALRLVEANRWQLAEYWFDQQLAETPLDALSLAYRGYAKDQQGNDGRQDIEQAIALEPALPISYFMLGMHHRKAGDYFLSWQAFADAQVLAPQNPAFAAELAYAYQLNDNYPQAEGWYEEALLRSENDQRFVRLMSAFYADTRYTMTEKGLAYVEDAAEQYPDDATIKASWGRLLHQTGDFDRAAPVLEAALDLASDDPRTLYFRAQLLEDQNRLSQALADYSQVANGDSLYRASAEQAIARLTR